METMTVSYDRKEKSVTCDPDTINVGRFCTEDIMLVLADEIVDKYDFPERPVVFKNATYAKRFSQVPLNKKALLLHDDNSEFHADPEDAKFTVTITNIKTGKKSSLDPRVVNN